MNTPTNHELLKRMVSVEEALRVFTECIPAETEAKILGKSVRTVFRERAARKQSRDEKLILGNKRQRRSAR